MFINGEPVEYSGERTEDAIYEWIKSKNDASVKELKTVEELEEFQKNSLAVVMLMNEGDEEPLKKYQTFTMNYEDVPFAYSTS